MPWMMLWAGGFPVFTQEASGARIVDVDGHEYIDLCLGDTGAMPGHGPPTVVEAVRAQLGRGITTMLPTEDAIVVGEELSRRFGMARWLFTLTATDANRTALRLARQLTGRPLALRRAGGGDAREHRARTAGRPAVHGGHEAAAEHADPQGSAHQTSVASLGSQSSGRAGRGATVLSTSTFSPVSAASSSDSITSVTW